MDDIEGFEKLVAARNFMKTSLEKSKALNSALEQSGQRLEETNRRLESLETAWKPFPVQKSALLELRGHIDCAVGPATAVSEVFYAVQELEESIVSTPCSDLLRYISVIDRFEAVLRFLADNCKLAIQWLEDAVLYLKDNAVASDRCFSNLSKSLKILRVLQVRSEAACLDGGLLSAAFDKLEIEFKRLLTENCLPMNYSSSRIEEHACFAALLLPGPVIEKLEAILERLKAKNRLEKCSYVYTEVRLLNVRSSLQALDLEYLEKPASKFEYVLVIDGYIDQWGKHLEFALKHLFELEFQLCNEVFKKVGLDEGMRCFAMISTKSGILDLLEFANKATEAKKDPIKLLKLLDIFATLNNLRYDFNRLFGRRDCIEIQTLTKSIIKKVVDGASEIFWELPFQVESQRQTSPPSDGSIPRLVSFVTEYCNQLLDNNYKPILTQVLLIHQSWKHENFHEELVTENVYNIVKEVELNIESWSSAYKDTTLSTIFMMNTHWHFYVTLKATRLGELMGDNWFRGHEQHMERYLAIYLGESWGRLPSLLARDGIIESTDRRAMARDVVKKRLNAFKEVFDQLHKKQSNCAFGDTSLGEKICQLVVKTVVPSYRRFLLNYGPLSEQDSSVHIFPIYTADSLEKMLRALFQPKLGNCGSIKQTHLTGEIRSVVTDKFRSPPIAT